MYALLEDFAAWPYWLGEIFLLAGLLISFLAGVAASCFSTFSRVKLDELLSQLPQPRRDRVARRLTRDLDEDDRNEYAAHALATISGLMWSIGLVLPGYKWACQWLGAGRFGDVAAVDYGWYLLAAITVLAVLTIGLPRVLALLAAERLLIRYSRLFLILIFPTLILSQAAEWIDRVFGRLKGESAPTGIQDIHEEIGELLDEGQRGGHLKEDAGKMIDGVFRLHEKDVRAVMTPRTDMYCLPVEMSLEVAVAKANESGMSRLPVYENTRDSIVGVFYAKDVLKHLDNNRLKVMTLRDIMREPFFIPETRQLDGLLEELQRNKVHIAIVLDEFGGTAGLITVEDIVEEVVGEIFDEYEAPESAEIVRVNDLEIVALGKTPILRVNEQLGLSLPHDEDYDTIAGYVLAQLGRIPQVGESCDFGPLHIEILAGNPRKIEKLRITKVEPVHTEEAAVREGEMATTSK